MPIIKRFAPLWALALLAAVLSVTSTPAQAATTSIAVDGSQSGRTFDGIGAISGGGGNSRLLTDYPAAQQSQILDYMFKPGYGAALQSLKIEIGGDANSTDGSEPSIEHSRGTINCNAGYEFWLAEQAKARNPDIALYGLAWTAPGWINGGFWSTDTINYVVSWLGCAKQHGLSIKYLGGWNERGHDANWYIQLRSTLNSAGYGSVQIVANDNGWDVADDMAKNQAFSNAVSIIGTHYTCGYGNDNIGQTCSTTNTARNSGKPLWNSEGGSNDMNTGAPALIRQITRGYTDARLTSYYNWPLIAAITPNLPYSTVGLATAGSPWSGNYTIGASTWATAQVTQFTKPGWKFIDSASGYLGGSESNGSYITLKSNTSSDYSTVLETTTSGSSQTVNVHVQGGLSTGTVHVWATKLNASSDATSFGHTQDITPNNGSYSLTMQPGYAYTVSTLNTAGKGTATAPAVHSLALPHNDNFDGYATGTQARYMSDMQGSFEVQPCTGRSGKCVQQMAPVKPIEWQSDSDAYTLVGDTAWSNYTVSADVLLRGAGTTELLGRANTQLRPQSHMNAYYLRIRDNGQWWIEKMYTDGSNHTLATGTTTALGTGTWHNLSFAFQGSQITAKVDGKQIGSVNDSSFQSGQAGLGIQGYRTDQFDSLSITPGSGTGGGTGTGPVTSALNAGKCLDDYTGSTAPGAVVDIWDCNGSGAQQWTVGNGAVTNNGLCLDIVGNATVNGTLVNLWTCNGQGNQQWNVSNGTLVNPASGRCLDIPGGNTANGTKLAIWDCNGGTNQKWNIPAAS
ncbi:ricin-type beta-trefoil lectin domain protein [Streptomyces sp. So13.3]|uniref:RICIN domain-containing protein n=1 Tax=Streptomyces sp. So13.3 TaxID=2136173 RepID=UPI001106153C|nr:ricin-type beta-trefoil lectin domain protein [Streptomyces sp. So13.3]